MEYSATDPTREERDHGVVVAEENKLNSRYGVGLKIRLIGGYEFTILGVKRYTHLSFSPVMDSRVHTFLFNFFVKQVLTNRI